MAKTNQDNRKRLLVRQARLTDVPELVTLTDRVYGEGEGHSKEMLRGQQAHFPEGQFVAVYDDRIVGYCATFRIDEATALAPHTWSEITGGGFASRHDPEGDWLYGMEVVVHPDMRGMRIGQRLYTARKKLCMELRLRGIVFGGRVPGHGPRHQALSAAPRTTCRRCSRADGATRP